MKMMWQPLAKTGAYKVCTKINFFPFRRNMMLTKESNVTKNTTVLVGRLDQQTSRTDISKADV